jgi:hypothetical protein
MGNGLIGFLKVLRAGQLGADEAIKADAFFGGFDRAGLLVRRPKLVTDFIPEPKPRDRREMIVIGHQNRACFKGMGGDPDII